MVNILVVDNFLDAEEIDLLYDICWNSDLYLRGVESNYSSEDRDSRKWSLTKFIDLRDVNYRFYNKLAKRIPKYMTKSVQRWIKQVK